MSIILNAISASIPVKRSVQPNVKYSADVVIKDIKGATNYIPKNIPVSIFPGVYGSRTNSKISTAKSTAIIAKNSIINNMSVPEELLILIIYVVLRKFKKIIVI